MALSESIKHALEKERERLHKEHLLYEEKTKQRLHHVLDRKEMVERCLMTARAMENDARHSALEVLRAERSRNFEEAQVRRHVTRHFEFYSERWLSLARWMLFPKYDVRDRPPTEEECERAMRNIYTVEASVELKALEAVEDRVRAHEILELVDIALNIEPVEPIDKVIVRLLSMSKEERRTYAKVSWSSDPESIAQIFRYSMERMKAASEKHAEHATKDPVHGGSSGSPHT